MSTPDDRSEVLGAAIRAATEVAATAGFEAGCADLAATLLAQGVPEPAAIDAAEVFAAGSTDLDASKLAARAVVAAYVAAGRSQDHVLLLGNRTDAGNAERLVRLHGRDLRHAAGLGWLAWDGRRWTDDDTGEVHRRALDTVRRAYRAADEIGGDDARAAAKKWALASESASRLDAAVKIARTDARLVARADDLDADPYALNVANGTVDLQTGELRAHDRRDLLTKLAPVTFDPLARAPRFEQFLREVFEGDESLIAWVQRAVGYSLTGDTTEQVAFFLHGQGANGKSTLLELLGVLLGTYSVAADAATFTTAASGRSVRSDLARLRGARLVRAAEVDRDAHLAESLVKQLTGGESITAAHKHRDEFEFHPQLKLWLAVNDLPRVGAGGHALWRRMRVVPFDASFARPDRGLSAALRAELPGVLAWAVAGALSWRGRGLGTCPAVERATSAYRGAEDRVVAFVAECCAVEPGARESVAALTDAYEEWEKQQGRPPVRDLHDRLGALGFERAKSGSTRYRKGLRLLTGEPEGHPGTPIPELSRESLMESSGKAVPACPSELPEGIAA